MTRSSALPDDIQAAVAVSIFGGLRVLRPAVDVVSRPPRERIILATLLAARGQTVSIGELIDSLWGESPPSTAVNQVQRHVGELRRVLEPDLPSRTVGRAVLGAGEGYRIDPQVVRSDLDRVSDIWTFARAAGRDDAAPAYAEALALAAAAPFSGLGWDVLTRPAFAAIERDRIALALDAADCALGLGDPSPLVDAVERIAADAPLDERLQARLVRLLGRIGRRAEAVAVYDAVRRRLHDDLAAAPGAELQDAMDEVLSDEVTGAPAADIPRKLPLAPAGIVARGGVSGLLDLALESALRGEPAILAISGMAGLGKTTLAVQWAHAVADRFPDGQLFINVRGYSPAGEALSGSDALRQLLTDLGASVASLPSDEQSLGEAYRKAIAGRRMVIVLDNAASAEQARALLPGTGGCLVFVTSRPQLSGLVVNEGAVSLPLARLTNDEARELLARRLGADRLDSDTLSVDSIIASCAGLPLALALAAAASASTAQDSIHDVADSLSATATALDVFALDEINDLRSAFEWSYRSLSEDAALLFRLASVHPGVTHPRNALASITAFDLPRTSVALTELVAANMFVRVGKQEFAVHDLLRLYARELAGETAERQAAQQRLVAHYVHMTRSAYMTFGREPVVEVESAPPVPEAIIRFSNSDDAVRWYVAERTAIIETFSIAIDLGLDREAALIALDWRPMRQYADPAAEIAETSARATDAAERSGDEHLEVELRRDLAIQLSWSGHDSDARRHMGRVLDTYRNWGDAAGESNALRNMSDIVKSPDERLALSAQALDAARRSGRSDILAICLVHRSGIVLLLGPLEEYSALNEEADEHIRASNSVYLAPYVAVGRAIAHARRGRFEDALEAVSATDESLDVMIQWLGSMARVIAAAGADRREMAYDARDRFARLSEDYAEFLGRDEANGDEYHVFPGWVDEAIAAMEARLSP